MQKRKINTHAKLRDITCSYLLHPIPTIQAERKSSVPLPNPFVIPNHTEFT